MQVRIPKPLWCGGQSAVFLASHTWTYVSRRCPLRRSFIDLLINCFAASSAASFSLSLFLPFCDFVHTLKLWCGSQKRTLVWKNTLSVHHKRTKQNTTQTMQPKQSRETSCLSVTKNSKCAVRSVRVSGGKSVPDGSSVKCAVWNQMWTSSILQANLKSIVSRTKDSERLPFPLPTLLSLFILHLQTQLIADPH